jgi:hypothetical protein
LKRREFVGTCAIVGLGLAIGLPGEIDGQTPNVSITSSTREILPLYTSPWGGCTEAGLTMFDKGPFRRDCFGIFE